MPANTLRPLLFCALRLYVNLWYCLLFLLVGQDLQVSQRDSGLVEVSHRNWTRLLTSMTLHDSARPCTSLQTLRAMTSLRSRTKLNTTFSLAASTKTGLKLLILNPISASRNGDTILDRSSIGVIRSQCVLMWEMIFCKLTPFLLAIMIFSC